ALSRDAMVQAIARRPSRFFASLDHLLDAPRALGYRNEVARVRPGDAPGVADLRLAALFRAPRSHFANALAQRQPRRPLWNRPIFRLGPLDSEAGVPHRRRHLDHRAPARTARAC